MWFTEPFANKIGLITTSGWFSEFPVPRAGSQPWGITAGPDGALWFTESSADRVARVPTSGTFTDEVMVPTANSDPHGITVGPDRALWFTEFTGNTIGRVRVATVPTNIHECLHGGWRRLVDEQGRPFRNHGRCVASVQPGRRRSGRGLEQPHERRAATGADASPFEQADLVRAFHRGTRHDTASFR